MDDPWRAVLDAFGARVDEDLLASIYRAASLDALRVRQELSEQDLPFHDPATGRQPSRDELSIAADAVIARAARRATLRGALGGMSGALTIPPEVAAAIVQTLRLGQRLAVVYGFDPESDRGKLLLARAVARGWEVDVPLDGPLGLTLRDLSLVLSSRLPTISNATAGLARALAVRAAVTTGGRLSRLVPGLGAGIAGFQARRSTREQGARMRAVYERAWDGAALFDGPEEDAVEVPL